MHKNPIYKNKNAMQNFAWRFYFNSYRTAITRSGICPVSANRLFNYLLLIPSFQSFDHVKKAAPTTSTTHNMITNIIYSPLFSINF